MQTMNGKVQPLISIITPVYNGSRWLEELILSVLEQNYPRIEHIIIDDGSNDGGATVAILKRYPHLRWWSRPNKGQCPTQNEALAAAAGDIITIICADDKYAEATAISSAVKLLTRCPGYGAVYGETIMVDESGREVDKQPPRSGPLWLFRYYPVVFHCSLLVRRRVIVDGGIFFDESFPRSGDYDWIIRLIKSGCRFKRLRKPIAKYRTHPMQLSGRLDAARIKELQRVLQLHGGLNVVILFLVNKWVQLIKLKNLVLRRGFVEAFRAAKARWNRDKTKQPSRS
jgi:glycosyltransferase involved in cell wall biosynthesis